MSRKFIIGLCALFVCALVVPAFAVDIALEAELGDVEEPMVIAVPADAASQGGPEPGAPSSGEFVWAPGPPTTGDPIDHTGGVTMTFTVPSAGQYAIWGRVTAWDGNSDSFWVKVEGADPDEQPQETQNTHFRWGVAQSQDWAWDKVNQWLDGGTFERMWDLAAGEQTLFVGTREAATMLDSVFITDNLSDEEADVALRLPTAADIALQTGSTTAVEPAGKLATRWADLKR